MKEKGEIPGQHEMGNVEAALKLAGELAQKTATLTARAIKAAPVTSLGFGLITGGIIILKMNQTDLSMVVFSTGVVTALVGIFIEMIP